MALLKLLTLKNIKDMFIVHKGVADPPPSQTGILDQSRNIESRKKNENMVYFIKTEGHIKRNRLTQTL